MWNKISIQALLESWKRYVGLGAVDSVIIPFIARCYTRYPSVSFSWSGTAELVRQEDFEHNSIPYSLALFRVPLREKAEITVAVNAPGAITEIVPKSYKIIGLFEDFQAPTPSSWQTSGLWHFTQELLPCADCFLLAGGYARYGKPGNCSYSETDKKGHAIRTQGELVSPAINVIPNSYVLISFNFYRHVENNKKELDKIEFYVRFSENGEKWTQWKKVWARSSSDESPECGSFDTIENTKTYSFLQVKWVFDSGNDKENDFFGFALDDFFVIQNALFVESGATGSSAKNATSTEEISQKERLRVTNIPNPIREVHSTRFTVLGGKVEALRVEVYDLTGRLVWKAEAMGNELVWHTEDLTGLPLANGVYLYIAYLKVDGEWIRLELQKFVILR